MLPSQVLQNLVALKQLSVNLAQTVIVQESHEDGSPHLHALLVAKKKWDLGSYKNLDQLTGQHGNYQVAKSPSAVLQYILKEQRAIAVHPPDLDPQALLKEIQARIGGKAKTTGKMDQIATALIQGADLWETVKAHPGAGMVCNFLIIISRLLILLRFIFRR